MRMRPLIFLAILPLVPLLGCKTLSEISVGYADAITTSELPSEGSWSGVSVAFPTLTNIDPLASPSLVRYQIEAEEVESVKVTRVELEGPSGPCNLPFQTVELQLLAPDLGPTRLATGSGSGLGSGECLTWELASETELAPWFRQPSISIVALVDGEPVADSQSLSLQVNFLIDITDQ